MGQDVPNNPDKDAGSEAPVHSAQDVRQGEIILRTPARRAIFIAGLIGFVILAIIMKLAGAY